jgi:glyoxylate reductase
VRIDATRQHKLAACVDLVWGVHLAADLGDALTGDADVHCRAVGEHAAANNQVHVPAQNTRAETTCGGARADYDGGGMTSASRPRVFVTRIIPADGLEPIVAQTDADVWPEEPPPPRDELLRRVVGVDGVLSMVTDTIDEALLDRAGPQLKVVSNFAVGFDNVDVAACTRRGVAVGNTAGVLTETTADGAFALLMAVARRLPEAAEYVRQGNWRNWLPMLLLSPDIHHATLGILGFGRIGREVAKRARGFDMQVLYYSLHPAPPEEEARLGVRHASLDEVLEKSDFVTLHVSLTPETRHMMNKAAFSKMKKTAMLVNASRGPVVDPDDLYDALKNGVIAAAALDVTEPEPLPANHKLMSLSNCLVVPHIASASVATRGKMADVAAQNLLAGLKRQPLTSWVNPDVWRQAR